MAGGRIRALGVIGFVLDGDLLPTMGELALPGGGVNNPKPLARSLITLLLLRSFRYC